MSNTITVTACDNELIILAYQWGASFELCRVLSGNHNSVNVTLTIAPEPYQGTITLNGINQALSQNITQTLASGQYSLVLLGVNWGGPAQFTVDVNGTQYALPQGNPGEGLVFHSDPIAITV